jgi:hypothetical protein
VKRALGLGAGLAAIALVVGAVQGGTDPAPVAAALGQASPVTTAPVATTAPTPAPTTTAAPSGTVHNVPGRAKDAPVPASSAAGASRRAPAAKEHLAPGPFANCAEARAAGRHDIPIGDPAYRPKLDGPGGTPGIACETR